jgi:hypothetical protein
MTRLLACLLLFTAFAATGEEDHRAWQHGIDLLPVGDRLLLVWGSAGNPPRANPGGDWQHDVYYAWLDPREPRLPDPQVLVSQPEAQEPPSVAISAKGTVLMTTEDGNGGINQRAGLWDSALRVLRKYPFLIKRGGHSGHVAAMGDRFLVVYGEGWVERGGFLDRGTGKDIYARIVEDSGALLPETRIASGHRDGWPLVAASDRNWLVLWQRYPGLTLHAALVDANGKMAAQRQLGDRMPLRYAYDVEFAPQLGSFVVAGTSGDSGFVSLLSLAGKIVRTRKGLPPMAAESRLVLGQSGAQLIGVYPVKPRGIAVLRLSAEAIELVRVIDHPYMWQDAGTTGRFLSSDRVLFATLSTTGLQLISVDLRN